jgi:protein-tyrosine kinase
MSKFFNETQKANQWAQQKLASLGMDVRQMLESIKQGSSMGADSPLADAQLSQCRQVQVGNPAGARLVLRQDHSSMAALEAYRGLRTRLMRAQSKSGLKSIAITSGLPGDGKTLTTMNLGLCYAQLPQQRVLLIDADLRTCGLTGMLDQPGTPGLAEVLAGNVSPDEAIVATNQTNLFVLPAGTVSSSPPELFTGQRWQEFLNHCGELFKVILVDTPPILPLADFELISIACDGILTVVRAHHGQRDALQKTASALDPKKLLGVVFNATEVARHDSYNYGYGYGYGKS